MLMPGDSDAVKGKKLQRSSLRRAWQFARPYRRTILVFYNPGGGKPVERYSVGRFDMEKLFTL
ncbi:MAG: hypothetical protein ABMA25_28445, partial [Ilumatobacteraceae bacterium]